jgi:peptidylprolyl isomerase
MRPTRLLLLAFLGTACLSVPEPKDEPSDPATETFASGLGIDVARMTRTEHGVYFADARPGDGEQLAKPRVVSISYTAYLRTGEIFDRAASARAVDLTQTGIAGFPEGIMGMRVGGLRRIVIPSALGYGARGHPGLGVPGNATLIYEVELWAIP